LPPSPGRSIAIAIEGAAGASILAGKMIFWDNHIRAACRAQRLAR
jgi:hypothetical protein